MVIIIGLGNIGVQYQNTYHNLGFRAVDKFGNIVGIEIDKKKYKALIGKGVFEGNEILLAKPITYMNNSGECAFALKKKFPNAKIIVVVDDIDLPKGVVRFRERGKSGTHNGLRSIVSYIGEEFERVRIGIGRDERKDLADYVLSNIRSDEQEIFDQALDKVCEILKERIFDFK